jgi:hypothetical protein
LAGASARIFTTLQQKNAGTAMLRGAMLSKFFYLFIFSATDDNMLI